ncbi:HalOD1 output domain-containing protein [Halomarina halobia]|uniref:HalOD1 output domain-containing protein n=1 Tax=Halomarina halobia TaxID=3033386 RepID=A0ABD6ACN2_9EURY|nr:HalOD1 output domain-containing protein [Halomarina sp. PSR21]
MSDDERPADRRIPAEAPETIHVTYDWSVTSPSVAVVETVARAMDREPMAMIPLHESVDPDALDALFQPLPEDRSPTDVSILMTYAGYAVTVRYTGDVTARRADPGRTE